MTRPAPTNLDPAVVGVIAVGGGVGSVLRYLLAEAVPPAGNGFPTATLITNLVGSLLLGMLVVAVTEVWAPHHLLRPALGTGLLGGFTTFSTFGLEAHLLPATVSIPYVAASLLGGLACAAAGMAAMRTLEPRATTHDAVDPLDPDLP